jgi:hypothetical protein
MAEPPHYLYDMVMTPLKKWDRRKRQRRLSVYWNFQNPFSVKKTKKVDLTIQIAWSLLNTNAAPPVQPRTLVPERGVDLDPG